MNTKDPKILLAIPVYNEEKHLNAVLDEVKRYISDILVIDDGSTDNSRALLCRQPNICLISCPQNRGYGRTIMDAFHFAVGRDYDWIITMDCDLQHEPARIPEFIAAIHTDDADIISGSRYLPESQCNGCPPSDRRKINRLITDMINQQLNLNLTDAFCGFKAHRVSVVKDMKLTENGYALPLEFWVLVAASNLRIKEIPISLIYNDPNRSFGGTLDDADIRLEHYKKVFERTLQQTAMV